MTPNARLSGLRAGNALALTNGMAAVKIGASRQVIIPKKVYEELGLAAGDYLDVQVRDGNLLMSPKTLVDKPISNHKEGDHDA
jgi:AbrB family looped-hinge helix DNA binding protein